MKNYLILLIVLMMTSYSMSSEITRNINLKWDDISIEENDNYTRIFIPQQDLIRNPGHPQLPVITELFEIPNGEKVVDIDLKINNWSDRNINYPVFPVQPERPISLMTKNINYEFVDLNKNLILDIYPKSVIEGFKQINVYNKNIAFVYIKPVRYDHRNKKISLATDFDIILKTIPEISVSPLKSDLKVNKINTKVMESVFGLKLTTVPVQDIDEKYDYILITNRELEPYFSEYIQWKNQKGIRAKSVTVEWIKANYKGIDVPDEIRKFIKFAYENWGVKWVTLAGDAIDDYTVIPCRYAYALTAGVGLHGRENNLPCDLYYADLDGNWNSNGNDKYGEVGDDVNMIPEVYVARLPVVTSTNVKTITKKLLTYEKNPDVLMYNINILIGEVLWRSPMTNGGTAKDIISERYFPREFDILKLYETRGTIYLDTVLAALNSGFLCVNHEGHGWIDTWSIGGSRLVNNDFLNLKNGNRLGTIFSVGCWTNAFDFGSIAEASLLAKDGGAIAYMGNSSYGWGTPGQPGLGPTDLFDQSFFKYYFRSNLYRISEIGAACKLHYIDRSYSPNFFRWHQFELNLLGDAEMMVYKKIPEKINIVIPDEIPGGNVTIPVTITSRGSPVPNATVCIMSDEIYVVGTTNENGQLNLNLNISNSSSLLVTATGPDCIPAQKEIKVFAEGPYVAFKEYELKDSNSDGFIYPGEDVVADIIFTNLGKEESNNIKFNCTPDNEYLTISKGSGEINNLKPGQEISLKDAVSFKVSNNAYNGLPLTISSVITDDQNHRWNQKISFRVKTPVIKTLNYLFDDFENGEYIQPEKSILFCLEGKNTGLATSHNLIINVEPLDTILEFQNKTQLINKNIYPDEVFRSPIYNVRIKQVEVPHFSPVKISYNSDNLIFEDSIYVTIGPTGFYDNMESILERKWERPASTNPWHFSKMNSYSGNQSLFCGNEEGGGYPGDLDARLHSKEFIVPTNASLNFWYWENLPVFGSDGLFIDVRFGEYQWNTITYIGAGDIFSSKNAPAQIGERKWHFESKPIEGLVPGSKSKLRLRFISESAGSEGTGIFIDDIAISDGNKHNTILSTDIRKNKNISPVSLSNIIKNTLRIHLDSDFSAESLELYLFDIKGRKVASNKFIYNEINKNLLEWNLNEISIPDGIYLLKIISNQKDNKAKVKWNYKIIINKVYF